MVLRLVRDEGEPVGVLALQGDFREHIKLLRQLRARPVEVRSPSDLEKVEALVVPGGESTAISFLLETSGLLEPVRARLREGMPTFGTCAGMILLAREILDGRPDQHCLGAIDIVVRRNAFGRQKESFEADLDVRGLGPPLHAVFIRAPVVEKAGPGVEVLASVDGRPVLCRQGPCLVSAFHPELADDLRLHQLFLESLTQRKENVRAF
ncbi:MAG: pyridoxal 5'-phosphate synthase glutaminase subunit PdxT [Acidimicrobiales bacterium]